MWLKYNRCMFTMFIFVLVYHSCRAISSGEFNQHIRDYSMVNDDINITNVKTLQKENIAPGRYASFAPLQNVVRFKEVPDNVLSGTSHGRGLHHDHSGIGLIGYEDPHHGYGYELSHDDHHDPHDFHHYDFHNHHYDGPHLGYGHQHKHYDPHALAAKTILWPIAGIALLGAAAALVSHPVLLQLGVVSGRKKRHTDNMDIVKESIKKWSPNSDTKRDKRVLSEQSIPAFLLKRRFLKNNLLKPAEVTKDVFELDPNFKILTEMQQHSDIESDGMIPVPLKIKKP